MTTPHMLPWRLVALQLCSSPDPAANLAQISTLLLSLPPSHRPTLVGLPEGALCFDGAADANVQMQEPLGCGPVQRQLAAIALQFQVYLLVGTFPTTTSDPTRFSASSLLFGPQGDLLADYQKIHLFDALVSDGTGQYRESSRTLPGDKLTLATLGTDKALKLGLAVCYDMRFASMFQALRQQQMNVLALPSAFTTVTGAAHWHTLLRARAIETQSFVLAPAQTGRHQNGRETYGHSLIIDPWGEILADAGTVPGLIVADIDLMQVIQLRERMPLQHHNRFKSEFL